MQILYISWDDMRHVGLPVLTESVDDLSAGTCESFIPVKLIYNICALIFVHPTRWLSPSTWYEVLSILLGVVGCTFLVD